MSAGPQMARVFKSFPSETCIFPATAARPAQKCRIFTCHLMPPSDKAKRTGFRGCLAARKCRVFTGREHNGGKTACFCGPTRPPLADPSPAGGAGPGCATPRENLRFRLQNAVLPRRQALLGAKTRVFSALPPPRRPLPGRPRANPASMREGFCTSGPNLPCFTVRTGPPRTRPGHWAARPEKHGSFARNMPKVSCFSSRGPPLRSGCDLARENTAL